MIDITPPTEKQYSYASSISEKLNIDLPEEFSKSAYSEFIDKYKFKLRFEENKWSNKSYDRDDDEDDEDEYYD
jgi:long-subunit fatty acid transport protein